MKVEDTKRRACRPLFSFLSKLECLPISVVASIGPQHARGGEKEGRQRQRGDRERGEVIQRKVETEKEERHRKRGDRERGETEKEGRQRKRGDGKRGET